MIWEIPCLGSWQSHASLLPLSSLPASPSLPSLLSVSSAFHPLSFQARLTLSMTPAWLLCFSLFGFFPDPLSPFPRHQHLPFSPPSPTPRPPLSFPGHLNAKCDTYAFGVFLLELLTGLTVVNPNFEKIRKQLAASVELPSPSTIVDERIRSQCSKKEALVCLTLSKYAVAGKWDARPDMSTILQKLQVLTKGS